MPYLRCKVTAEVGACRSMKELLIERNCSSAVKRVRLRNNMFDQASECRSDVKFSMLCNRIPEAAFMARTYLPSEVSNVVGLWRNDLKKINVKAAESLADPQEYPNFFPDWELACEEEVKQREQRSKLLPAKEYLNYVNGVSVDGDLVDEMEGLHVAEEAPDQNGGSVHENGGYMELQEQEVYQDGEYVEEDHHDVVDVSDEVGFGEADQFIEGEGELLEPHPVNGTNDAAEEWGLEGGEPPHPDE